MGSRGGVVRRASHPAHQRRGGAEAPSSEPMAVRDRELAAERAHGSDVFPASDGRRALFFEGRRRQNDDRPRFCIEGGAALDSRETLGGEFLGEAPWYASFVLSDGPAQCGKRVLHMVQTFARTEGEEMTSEALSTR